MRAPPSAQLWQFARGYSYTDTTFCSLILLTPYIIKFLKKSFLLFLTFKDNNMKNPLILLYYCVHSSYITPKGKNVMNVRYYPTLNDVRAALLKMAKRRKMTWEKLYDSDRVLLMRCYGRYDSATHKVVRVYDEVSKRSLQSYGI